MKKIFSVLKSSQLKDEKEFCGAKIGEKALLIALKERGVVLVADFVEAVKLKKALSALNKSVEIVSCGKEVGVEKDLNLVGFASAVSGFLSGKLDFVIFLPNAAITNFDKNFFMSPIKLEKGKNHEIAELVSKLTDFGYERVDLVENEGEFALRGDILDVFAVTEKQPVRFDFFDEEVEEIAYFNPNDMKIIKKIEKFSIFPAILSSGNDNVTDLCQTVVIDQKELLMQTTSMLIESFKTMENFNEKEFSSFEMFNGSLYFSLSDGKDLLSGAEISYIHSFNELADDIKSYNPDKNRVVLFAGDDVAKKRLQNFFLGKDIAFFDFEKDRTFSNGIYISNQYFPNSFKFSELNIVAIGSDNLSKQNKSFVSNAKKETFYQPRIGEYVVHEFHGIGKCKSIEKLRLTDCEKDYFVIEYKNGGTLYLPSEQASSLSAFVGGGEKDPQMNVLGGREFEQLKKKVKEKLEGFAIELINLYKERENSKGFVFKQEKFLEDEFANAFEFEETADQLQATKEVLTDMSSTKIMDRLLCGDVGFGKTEVAYRAAFRAVINNKQVAFLCPTTILSEQHYLNAKKRFEKFGVNIEVLNRFKTTAQTKDILNRTKNGDVDILIGTHRILSSDLEFKNLGLLIIDEEQRFGVAAKEKIKNLRKNIDVLALSATPIPRTLHMSLTGIRDISIIATPPRDRLPIQTYVTAEDEEVIKNVIRRELARGGKVFVIYNRVQTIFSIANYLSKLVPEAKIGIAHGQMKEKELQKTIDKLFNGEFNVFVSTTLIENGIDLPSANTMIIFDADLLGLSQLYQLRGRIGRSDKLSYAYLLYKEGKVLTQDSYNRLEAIKEFRELGSGFKISMRDLEIRGAGNIFGKEQHGHIEKVGYDMFIKLLNETVSELSGKKVNEEKPVRIDLPVDAFIPENYLPTSEQRISYYMKISEIGSSEDMQSVFESLVDGYGDVPQETKNLAKIAYIKNLAVNFNVKEVKSFGDEIKIVLYKDSQVVDKRLVSVLSKFGASLRFENLPIIKLPKNKPMIKMLDVLINFFEEAKKTES